MNDFQKALSSLSREFLTEARQSPQLLADMAKMEYYMAESYSGRTFAELLQNADDAGSTRISISVDHGNLYFANNGRPFNEEDLKAISRSGASAKSRGKTIGYRGVGFKSTSSLSDTILIWSSETLFTFARDIAADLLGRDPSQVPSIRIPLPAEYPNELVEEKISCLKAKGFTTVFVFIDAYVDNLESETEDIDIGSFLFLRNICKADIHLPVVTNSFDIHREKMDGYQLVSAQDGENYQTWAVFGGDKNSVAFLVKNQRIVPCSASQALYHCYLPTTEGCLFPCKINADFSTDPSRKHITLDSVSKRALKSAAAILLSLAQQAVANPDNSLLQGVFDVLIQRKAMSRINFEMDKIFLDEFSGNQWLLMGNGDFISPSEYKVFPPSAGISNPETIRGLSSVIQKDSLKPEVYHSVSNLEPFLKSFSRKEFSLKDLSMLLEDVNFVMAINHESLIQLTVGVIREARIAQTLGEEVDINPDNFLLPDTGGCYQKLSSFQNRENQFKSAVSEELNSRLQDSEKKWLKDKTGINISAPDKPEVKSKSAMRLQKWRSAEDKCLMIEKDMGNRAEDVSMRNVGYDIHSLTPEGRHRYIEVKSVKKDFAFSMTNNEYTAAHQYQDDFYICLLYENGHELTARYIQNPLKNATFEKQIRQWAWVNLTFTDSYSAVYPLN